MQQKAFIDLPPGFSQWLQWLPLMGKRLLLAVNFH